MLEFIVLGEVPGTHIQITFEQVALFSAGLLVAWLISQTAVYYYRNQKTKTKEKKEKRFFKLYRPA